jgi:phosphoglucomutase
MNDLHGRGMQNLSLGFMPDCDGDRGNVVFWNEKKNSAQTIEAQEVFALCVMAELAFEYWKNPRIKNLAVAVNCPTTMRVDEICGFMNAEIFRAEVGEANVVNLAAEKRSENFNVRIFGEGSNGGNITFPSCVRDPLATIFALIKILSIRDEKNKIGLFHIWCRKSNQEEKYRNDFTLNDVISTLPQFVTTGVSESRAILKVKMRDKGKLKENFKKQFELAWQNDREKFFAELGIFSYGCFLTNGTREIRGEENWNNGNGGLKIKFFDAQKNPSAFIWMRPSGTEAVFRILCDVKGSDREKEKKLLAWESDLIKKSEE